MEARESGPGEVATPSTVIRTRQREELYGEILLRFFVLMKAAQSCSLETDAYREALDDFLSPLSVCLAREESLVIGERDGYLYLNAVRARVDADAFAAQKFLVQTLVASEFAGILFEQGVAAGEIATFLDVFFRPGKPTSAQTFSDLLVEQKIRRIHPILRNQASDWSLLDGDQVPVATGQDEATTYFARTTYFKSIFVLKHLLDCVRPTCGVDLREAKQIVQGLVEHLLEDPDALVALDLIREADAVRFDYSVNVAILAAAIGSRVGFSRERVGDLGTAALFHDICETGLPAAWPRSTDAIGDGRLTSFRQIVAKGVKSPAMLHAAFVAYEHHDPATVASPADEHPVAAASLPARIVRLASRFVAMASAQGEGDLDPRAAVDQLEAALQRSELEPGLVAVLDAIVDEVAILS